MDDTAFTQEIAAAQALLPDIEAYTAASEQIRIRARDARLAAQA